LTGDLARRWHAGERDVASLRDAADDALRAGKQPGPVAAISELGRHELAAGLARKAVSDPLLESVPDFDPDPPFFHRNQDQNAVRASAQSATAAMTTTARWLIADR